MLSSRSPSSSSSHLLSSSPSSAPINSHKGNQAVHKPISTQHPHQPFSFQFQFQPRLRLLFGTMAKARKGTSSAQNKRTHVNPHRMFCLAILASLSLNLVLLTLLVNGLYKGRLAGLEAPPSSTESNPTSAVEEEEEKMVATRPALTDDSLINLDHGDPTMFESYWKRLGEKATVVIPGWHTMSYFSDPTNLCWFLETGFARELRRIHRLVGNAAVEDRHIVVGTGSTQLFQAAVYALSPPDSREPTTVVSAAPYYSSYPLVTDYLRSGLFRWGGDAYAFKGESYIELVCSPNNPDGLIREAVLKSEAGKTIHDLAYYWPQYTPITGQADHDIMLFTVSKSTGHAGTRLGWALVKDRDVARKMTKFIELNTIGVSKDSQLRAAKVLKVISDGYELPNPEGMDKLFDFGRRLMATRWDRLREAVKASGIFSLPDFPPETTCNFSKEKAGTYPAFAWLKCEQEEIKDCESFLSSLKILTRSGKHFGAGTNYVRVSMLDRDETFDLFIKRISSLG